MEVENDLVYNFILDMRKKNISPKKRAEIVAEYMKVNDWSLREASEKLEIPKTTLHDWLMYRCVDDDKIEELKSKGYTDTQIRRALQTGRLTNIEDLNQFDLLIKRIIESLQPYSNGKDVQIGNNTLMLISNLRELVVKIERKVHPLNKR